MIAHYTRTGRLHRRSAVPNQDSLSFMETREYIIAAIADGVSACSNSAAGACIASTEAVAYLNRHMDALGRFPPRKTAFLLLEQIRSKLTAAADAGRQAPESYASTLSACWLDKRSGSLCLFQLGDSPACLVARGQCTALFPSRPDCPSTMTRDAYQAIQVRQLHPRGPGILLLCTDGVSKACLDAFAATPGDLNALARQLDQQDPRDDCSFVAVPIPADE